MNKFFKYGLITAGISMAVGIVFALISTAVGGRIVVNNSRWPFRWLNIISFWDDWDDLDEINDGDGRIITFAGDNDRTSKDLRINGELSDIGNVLEPGEIASDGIRNLDFELGAGQFFIREKDTDDGVITITVQGKGDCDYYTEKDTLHVESFKGNHHIGEDLSHNQIIVELPKGISFDEVELTCGAAVVEADHLTANDLEVEAGAGDVRVSFANVKKFSANIGAGRVEASEMSAQEVDLEVGMGECIYQGTITRELDAECDLGNMEITVNGSEEDYNYEIECAAGNIDLGERSITGLSAERNINNGAQGTFELSCNMGNITVNFQD